MVTAPSPGAGVNDAGFAQHVADEMSRITTGRYNTHRRGGHALDRDEASRDRSFWPGIDFSPTTISSGPTLLTRFTVRNDERWYGLRVHLPSAIERWNLRIGIVDAVSHPTLFAAEVCWYLVVLVGAADLTAIEPDDQGVGWLNIATEVFGRLNVPSANSNWSEETPPVPHLTTHTTATRYYLGQPDT